MFETESHFARSTRLSKPSKDTYYIEILRHLAYIRYLQNNFKGALEAIYGALQVISNPKGDNFL